MNAIETERAVAVDQASGTVVGLLDALCDTMTLARPGADAARYAQDLRRLGDGAAFVAQELTAIVTGEARQSGRGKTPSPQPRRRIASAG